MKGQILQNPFTQPGLPYGSSVGKKKKKSAVKKFQSPYGGGVLSNQFKR